MAEDVFGGVKDAMGLMQTMALMNVYGQRSDQRDAELQLKQNDLDRKLAEDQVQTSLYKMQTRKYGEEALALESKREHLSLFSKLEAQRINRLYNPDAPDLSPEQHAQYNVIGKSYGLIDKFYQPDPLTDAKIANMNAHTRRIDAYMEQTGDWVPAIQNELGYTKRLYGLEESYALKKEQAQIPELERQLEIAKSKKAPVAKILEIEQKYQGAIATLHREMPVEEIARDVVQNRTVAIQQYRRRAEDAVKRAEVLSGSTKLKPEDFDQQRTLIEQEMKLYEALEQKAVTELDYLKALGDDKERAVVRKRLDGVNDYLASLSEGYKETAMAKERERGTYRLEMLNIAREKAQQQREKLEDTKEFRDHLTLAQAEFLRSDQSNERLAAISVKYGVPADKVVPATKKPNQPGVEVKLYDARQSPNEAGQFVAMQQAMTNLHAAKDLLIDEKGGVNRTVLGAAAINLPFSEGRSLNNLIQTAVEIKLRSATGAAAPEPEVKRYVKWFTPGLLDGDDLVKRKITGFEDWMKATVGTVDPTGELRERAKSVLGESAAPVTSPPKSKGGVPAAKEEWSIKLRKP